MTTIPGTAVAATAAAPEPFAVRGLGAISGVAAALLMLRADRYGYFGDELYFLSAGSRLAFGYADQGPLVPLLARWACGLAPDSMVVLRLPAIACAVAATWVTAAIARELGADRRAQVLAAAAYATSPFLITQAATLSTFAVDATLSATLLWILLRWMRIRDDRLLVPLAAVAAVDLEAKLLLPAFAAAFVLGILICGPREVVRHRRVWTAVALVTAAAAPSLWWQARHGWPQLAMGPVIAAEQRAATGGIAGLPTQLALLLGVCGLPLAGLGWWALLRAEAWRPFRFAAVGTAVLALFVVLTASRPYYLAGAFPLLLGAGAARLGRPERSRAVVATGFVALAISATIALAALFVLPLPATALRGSTDTQAAVSTRMRVFGVEGWRDLAAAVDTAARALPVGPGPRVVVITQNYWQAAALDRFAGAPVTVFSPNRGFAYFGTPPDATTTVLYVGAQSAETALREEFSSITVVSRLDAPEGFPGITHGVLIWRCDSPRSAWTDLWPRWRTLALTSNERRPS